MIFPIFILLLVSARIQAEMKSPCLYKPYLSSLAAQSIKITDKKVSLSLEFELSYKKAFKLENITIDLEKPGKLTVHPGRLIQLEDPKDIITYYRETTVFGNKTRSHNYMKEHYLLDLDKLYGLFKMELEQLPASEFLGKDVCSPFRIYAANFIVPNTAYDIHVNYHRPEICIKTMFRDETSNQWINFPRLTTIVSAAYTDRFTIAAAGTGTIYIDFKTVFGEKNPMDGPYNASGTYEMDDLIDDANCRAQINQIRTFLAKTTLDDAETYNPPFRTFLRIQDTYVALAPMKQWSIYNDDRLISFPKEQEIDIKAFRHPDRRLQAATVLDGHVHAIFIDYRAVGQTIYYNENFDNNYELHRPQMFPGYFVPDDITHWTTCEKIVSVYGFLYGLHGYFQNILQDPTLWKKLDRHQFDHPIEAMHAEGDSFWFFTRATTVLLMTADSRKCTELKFRRKQQVHYRQLLPSPPNQLLLDYRYYDGSKWVPDWDYVPPINIEQASNVWLYIAGGCVLGFVAMITLTILIFKSTSPRRGDIIYSRSRSSADSVVSKRSSPVVRAEHRKDPPTATTLPLFSEHNLSKTRSRDSSDSLGRAKKSPRKSKRKGASPKRRY